MGEKLSELEVFYPDRMASRILGMGDMLSIIEKAEESMDREETERLAKKLQKNKDLDLNDYLAQMKQVKKMGSFSSLLKLIPGMGDVSKLKVDDKQLTRIEAMIQSMTEEERRKPKIINGQRRLRIAKGSGTTVQEINNFMKSFELSQKVVKQMKNKKNVGDIMKNLQSGNFKQKFEIK